MASVYGIVRSIAKVGSPVPMLRSIVGRKPVLPTTKPQARVEGFAALVEGQIIPRLIVAHGRDTSALEFDVACSSCGASISSDEALVFAPLALNNDACTLLDRVEVFLDRGVSVDTVFVELLAPAARYLGTMWDEDEADFVGVTMALWRLQELVRELSSRVPARSDGDAPHRRALFSVMPGEDHSFGTVIVEDVFRRAGWQTELLTHCDTSELLGLVARVDFDLIGLTVTGSGHCETVPSVINGLRSVSRNPYVGVMVGGHAFAQDPALAMRLGADATAADATSALVIARDLVNGLAAQKVFCA